MAFAKLHMNLSYFIGKKVLNTGNDKKGKKKELEVVK